MISRKAEGGWGKGDVPLDFFPSAFPPPCRGYRDRLLAAQIGAGDAVLLAGDLLRRAEGDHVATEAACAGTKIEQAVRARHHFAVVLDHDQRVAQVAKLLQRGDQPGVVARVQPDRRLVEHVEHAAQSAAHLAGQADALRFAAGERRRGPAQRQVIEADVDEKRQSILDLADQLAGHLLLVRRQPPLLDLLQQLAERRAANLVERAAAEPYGGRIVAQPAAATLAAIDLADELLQQPPQPRREPRGFFERWVEAFVLEAEPRSRVSPRRGFRVSERLAYVHLNPLVTRAEQHDPPLARRQVVVRHVGGNTRVCRERGQHLLRDGQAHIRPH